MSNEYRITTCLLACVRCGNVEICQRIDEDLVMGLVG